MNRYRLDREGNVVPEPDLLAWAFWFEHSHESTGKDNRILKKDHVGPAEISTVFLGLDHAFWGTPHDPVLWETMIFANSEVSPHDQWQARYTSKEDAMVGHMEAVDMVSRWWVGEAADVAELEKIFAGTDWRKVGE